MANTSPNPRGSSSSDEAMGNELKHDIVSFKREQC
jgi:hypothetical protein